MAEEDDWQEPIDAEVLRQQEEELLKEEERAARGEEEGTAGGDGAGEAGTAAEGEGPMMASIEGEESLRVEEASNAVAEAHDEGGQAEEAEAGPQADGDAEQQQEEGGAEPTKAADGSGPAEDGDQPEGDYGGEASRPEGQGDGEEGTAAGAAEAGEETLGAADRGLAEEAAPEAAPEESQYAEAAEASQAPEAEEEGEQGGEAAPEGQEQEQQQQEQYEEGGPTEDEDNGQGREVADGPAEQNGFPEGEGRPASAAAAEAAPTAAEPPPEYEAVHAATQRSEEEREAPRPTANDYNHANLKAIDVEVNQGPGLPFKMVQVVLDYSELQHKSYLGGYKNKRSGVVYHHAWTQTPKQPKYLGVERKYERQTQTVKVKQRSGQTVREAATQMERPGVIIDTSEDRVMTPGRYQTSEERLEIVVRATMQIQRFWRGYLGRKRAAYLKEKKMEREAFLREQELKARQEAEEHRRKEIERRMHPQTAADFEILYNELEAWRLQETHKIKAAGLPQAKEQEVLQQLLHKETKLLQTIDRLKINANHENKDLRIQKTMAAMGKPKKFELKNGKTVEVHTPFTTRAMELMQLYNGLNLPMLTIDERLDVLLHVKWTVKEFDCNLTREVVDLIDREADLLNRGRNPRLLEGLRKRISSLFLTFIETPEFNPEAARFQIVPMEFESYLFEKLGRSEARADDMTGTAASKWDY